MSSPVVGVPANIFEAEDRRFYKNKELQLAETSMLEAIRTAGGLPVVLPIAEEGADVERLASMMDALLLAGGADISPGCYGETPLNPDWAGQPVRDRFELGLYAAMKAQGKPIFGVCRGFEMINVAEGGSLWQDLKSLREGSDVHRSQELYDGLGHSLRVVPGSLLAGILESESLEVNSVHHQGVRALGGELKAVAFAPDGLVEAVELSGDSFVLGVQWHPEWMPGRPDQAALFDAFIAAARTQMSTDGSGRMSRATNHSARGSSSSRSSVGRSRARTSASVQPVQTATDRAPMAWAARTSKMESPTTTTS